MDYKENIDGTYDVLKMKVSDLSLLIKLVRQSQIWRLEDAEQSIEALSNLPELPSSNPSLK